MKSLKPNNSMLGMAVKRLRSRKFAFCSLVLIVAYSMMTNTITEQQARQLLEEKERLRELITIDEGGGACDIGSPVEDAPNIPTVNSTRTLLASYPGSGKRFTWTVIKALTNYEVADDWNFSGKLRQNPLTIKTSWPHREGTWSWGKQMDQVLLLARNPRKAIPSYHTMRWELDYAKDWPSSYLRIPDTYMERPTVEKWEAWRDRRFKHEINSWFWFYDFWMQAGFMEDQNMTHIKCVYDLDCQPKQVVDFENLYSAEISDDFHRISQLLDSARDIDIIADQARACVLHNVFNRTGHQELNMHQASRPFANRTSEYIFTLPQYDRIMNRTIELRDKYSMEPLSLIEHADYLTQILDRYINENTAEFFHTVDLHLEEYVTEEFGDAECNNLVGDELTICNFIRNKNNHAIFFDNWYPDDFPYEEWFKVRNVKCHLIIKS